MLFWEVVGPLSFQPFCDWRKCGTHTHTHTRTISSLGGLRPLGGGGSGNRCHLTWTNPLEGLWVGGLCMEGLCTLMEVGDIFDMCTLLEAFVSLLLKFSENNPLPPGWHSTRANHLTCSLHWKWGDHLSLWWRGWGWGWRRSFRALFGTIANGLAHTSCRTQVP